MPGSTPGLGATFLIRSKCPKRDALRKKMKPKKLNFNDHQWFKWRQASPIFDQLIQEATAREVLLGNSKHVKGNGVGNCIYLPLTGMWNADEIVALSHELNHATDDMEDLLIEESEEYVNYGLINILIEGERRSFAKQMQVREELTTAGYMVTEFSQALSEDQIVDVYTKIYSK